MITNATDNAYVHRTIVGIGYKLMLGLNKLGT